MWARSGQLYANSHGRFPLANNLGPPPPSGPRRPRTAVAERRGFTEPSSSSVEIHPGTVLTPVTADGKRFGRLGSTLESKNNERIRNSTNITQGLEIVSYLCCKNSVRSCVATVLETNRNINLNTTWKKNVGSWNHPVKTRRKHRYSDIVRPVCNGN